MTRYSPVCSFHARRKSSCCLFSDTEICNNGCIKTPGNFLMTITQIYIHRPMASACWHRSAIMIFLIQILAVIGMGIHVENALNMNFSISITSDVHEELWNVARFLMYFLMSELLFGGACQFLLLLLSHGCRESCTRVLVSIKDFEPDPSLNSYTCKQCQEEYSTSSWHMCQFFLIIVHRSTLRISSEMTRSPVLFASLPLSCLVSPNAHHFAFRIRSK